MDANPNDVVTLLLVTGAGASASALASIADLAYTPTSLAATDRWPTLSSLIDNGARAMNFVASSDDDTAAPYLMDEFTHMFENRYDNLSPSNYSWKPDRPVDITSAATAISSGYMPFMNHFLYESQAFGIQSANESCIEMTNAPSGGAGNLGTHSATCASAFGRAPTFMLVDFFNAGPAIEVADTWNGISLTGRVAVSPEVLSETSAARSMFHHSIF